VVAGFDAEKVGELVLVELFDPLQVRPVDLQGEPVPLEVLAHAAEQRVCLESAGSAVVLAFPDLEPAGVKKMGRTYFCF